MGWTDENYSEPQGNWGQASVNDVGWGQSAVNAISWGMAHVLSWGHAITNLLGKLGIPTDNLNWSDWLSNYVPQSVNSGVGLDFIAGNGDYVDFNNVNLNSIWEVGCVMDMDTATPNTNFVFGNNTTSSAYITFASNRSLVRFGGGTDIVIFNTTLTGVTHICIIYTPIDNTFSCYSNGVFIGSTVRTTGGNSNINRIGGTLTSFSSFQLFKAYIKIDDLYVLNYKLFGGDGSLTTDYSHSINNGTIYGADWFTGSPHGEQLYKWGFNRYTTGGVLDNDNGTVYITGNSKDATTDVLGNAIALPAFEFVDNAPIASNHYSQLEDVANAINTSGDLTVCLWLSVTDYGDGGQVLTNGALTIAIDATNIEFSRDGVTTATYAHNSIDFIYAAFVSGSGVTDIWIGDVNNAPTKVSTAVACGTSTAATYPMHKNNNQALSDRFNGYNGVAAIYNNLADESVVQDVYSTTQSNIS